MNKRSNVVRLPLRARLVCSACGAGGDGTCDCGAPYVPAGERAADAIAANPEKSDRAIADEIGVGKDTIRRARKSTGASAPVKRTGKDGKARKMPERLPVPLNRQVNVLLGELGAAVDEAHDELGAFMVAHPELDQEGRKAVQHWLRTTARQLLTLAREFSE